jgi:hypothetical protein
MLNIWYGDHLKSDIFENMKKWNENIQMLLGA